MDDSKTLKEEISRRSLLKGMPAVAGIVVSFGTVALPEAAMAQTKLSHEVAKYQDMPKNGQECSTCLQFMPPNACKIVASPISPQGWCQFYAKKT
jgi:hypothetical protein